MDQTILKSHVEKLEKFKGSNFHRWQQKMLFYLTSLHVSYVRTNSEPTDPYLVDGENVPTEAQMADYEKAESFINKYRTQVACSKKFAVEKSLNFKMNDAKPVVKQVKELQIIVHEMEVEGIFEQLVLKLRVEEDNRMNEKADANSIEPNANMKVYHCWVCGKLGHKAKDYHHKKEHGGRNSEGNFNQANHVESPKEFAGVTESFLITNVVGWWFDTSATKHIYNSKRMFVSYQKVFGHVLEECPKYIGASATKNLKKINQTPKGIPVRQKMGFKPKQVYQPIFKKSTANTCGKKMNNSESTKEVSKSNPFEVLTSIDNDVDLGTNGGISNLADEGTINVSSSNTPIGEKIDKIERQICEGKLRFVDDDKNPLVHTGIVEVVLVETANLRISMTGKEGSDKGYGTNSLLEQ
ncbi:hypothetical protein Tco_0722545 [Tanacetum coccineum]